MPNGIGLRQSEITTALDTDDQRRRFPPILNVEQAAQLLGGVSEKTIYFWCAAGRFDGCFRKRGKHLLFWRDRVIERIFNGPDWENADEN